MMLGKRPRYPIHRTSSMIEITFDLNSSATDTEARAPLNEGRSPVAQARNQGLDHRMLAPSLSLSPRNFRRNSADFSLETPNFLRSCLLCKRPLAPCNDIYMYKGDSAFCSAECREKQMKRDEKDKCSISATKKESTPTTSTVKSQSSA